MSDPARPIQPIDPPAIEIVGVRALVRPIHQDPRGFLVETMRHDDVAIDGSKFAMSYTSVTVPGEFRDRDRWHVHKVQTDRFVVPLGEMMLSLYDGRPGSASHGRLEVIRMRGAPMGSTGALAKRSFDTYLVPIPPGVYHCIGNLSDEIFALVNYPTELFNPADEGRVAFTDVPVARLGRGFAWELIDPGPKDRLRPS